MQVIKCQLIINNSRIKGRLFDYRNYKASILLDCSINNLLEYSPNKTAIFCKRKYIQCPMDSNVSSMRWQCQRNNMWYDSRIKLPLLKYQLFITISIAMASVSLNNIKTVFSSIPLARMLPVLLIKNRAFWGEDRRKTF